MPTPTIYKGPTLGGAANPPALDGLRAAAAYSLRRIVPSYHGPAIRVRRSIDNAEIDIPFCYDPVSRERVACVNTIRSFVGSQNLLTYSEQFDHANWSKTVNLVVTQNAGVAPNGTTTAERITPPNATGNCAVAHGYTYAAAVYTASVHAKADGYNFCQIFTTNANSAGFVNFNLTTGAVTNSSLWTGTSVYEGNGWWRLIVTTNTVNGGGSNIGCHVLVTGNESRYPATVTTNGTDGILLWGFQLNLGAVQPYSQTVATARDGHGYVTVWYDQSGNVRNLTQPTAAAQPSIVSAGELVTDNNRLFVSFDGTDDVLNSTAGVANTVMANMPFTANYVSSGTAASANFGWCGNSADGLIAVPRLFCIRGSYAYNNLSRVTISAAAGRRVITCGHDGVSTPFGFLDGTGLAANAENVVEAFGGTGTISIPAQAGSTYHPGFAAELVFFSSHLSSSERQRMERNQGKFYGVTVA
jgi:hypothetical protein